jgi:hypothetical protein
MESFVDITRKGVSAFAKARPANQRQVLEVTITPVQYDSALVTVADSQATEQSLITAQVHPNIDFDADDLSDITVSATAGVLNGTVDLTICSNLGPLVGTYKISYLVG